MLFSQIFPSRVDVLLYCFAAEENNASPAIQHAANGIFELNFIVFESENARKSLEWDDTGIALIDGFVAVEIPWAA